MGYVKGAEKLRHPRYVQWFLIAGSEVLGKDKETFVIYRAKMGGNHLRNKVEETETAFIWCRVLVSCLALSLKSESKRC